MTKRTISLILTILGVGGVGATSFLSVRCSKKADEKQTKKEKLICYAPAIICGVGTSACIIGSHHVSRKEIAALTATCTYLTANRDKIKNKIKEHFGEGEAKKIDEEIAKEEANKKTGQTIEETGYGDTIFVEMYLGRKFKSSIKHVEWAMDQLNYELHNGNPVSMNTFYEYLGIEPSIAGDQFGWPANEEYYDYTIDRPIDFDIWKIEDEDGNLAYAIDIKYGYRPCDYWLEV